jgi:hypothetical protein
MITSRDRVIKALTHQPIDRAPRDLWIARRTELLAGDDVVEMLLRYPADILRPEFQYPRGHRVRGRPYECGQHTDAWGCTWLVRERAAPGKLTGHPLADPSQVPPYQPPWEILDGANLNRVNRDCAATSQFVLARTESGPFQRLRLLRGTAAALADLQNGCKETGRLLARLHDFCHREITAWAASEVDGVAFGDNWVCDGAPLVSRQAWRRLLKPFYRQYCQILHEQDKFAFFHCAGNAAEVFRDLVQIGVDAIHCDLTSLNVEALARHFRGKIAFWGGIDDEKALTRGRPEDVRAAVQRIRRSLDFGSGGLIAQCAWEPRMSFKNVAAVFEHWLEPILAHA